MDGSREATQLEVRELLMRCLCAVVALALGSFAFAQSQPADVVVFAVSQDADRPGQITLDPVVKLQGSADSPYKQTRALMDPISGVADSERLVSEFAERYLKPGLQYPTYSGGQMIGIATVRDSSAMGGDGGCVDLTAQAQGSGAARLAVTTNLFGSHPNRRRRATPAERKAFVHAASRFLADFGISKQLLQRMKVHGLLATEFKRGEPALVGRASVRSRTAEHHLFLVVEKGVVTLSSLDTTRDLDDGTDQKLVSFIDQLDLDQDGVDEVITMAVYYENRAYSIWKRGRNGWYKAYDGGGGGC